MEGHFIAFFLLLLLTACASTPNVEFMKYTSESFPPTRKVEVLRAKPIYEEFIELGELSVRLRKDTAENAVLYLKEKARSIGADVIIILGEASTGAVMVPVGTMYAKVEKRYLKALAIKYK